MLNRTSAVFATLMLSAGLAATAAQAQALPAKIKEAGKLVIANVPNYPPMEFRDPATNTLMGVDIELGEAIAKELGVKVEWSGVGFEQMMPSLQTGRVDIILSGMTDLPTRRDTADFVNYLKSGAQFFTQASRAAEFKDPTDFCGKNVGMSRRTSFPAETEKWSEANCVAKGKPPIKVVGTEGSVDARNQLKQGRIDGAVQGNETIPYIIKMDPNTFVAVGGAFSSVQQGIAVSKTDPALRDAIAGAFKKVMADGTYKKILDKYGIGETAIDMVRVNGEPAK